MERPVKLELVAFCLYNSATKFGEAHELPLWRLTLPKGCDCWIPCSLK